MLRAVADEGETAVAWLWLSQVARFVYSIGVWNGRGSGLVGWRLVQVSLYPVRVCWQAGLFFG